MADRSLNWARVEEGRIVEGRLPASGVLSDGRAVSNYHELPDKILQSEGWRLVEDPGLPQYYNADRYSGYKTDLVLREDGKVVVEYTLLPGLPRVEVTADSVVRVFAPGLNSITFRVDDGDPIEVVTTEDVAELELSSAGEPGVVTVYVEELEEQVEVSIPWPSNP